MSAKEIRSLLMSNDMTVDNCIELFRLMRVLKQLERHNKYEYGYKQ